MRTKLKTHLITVSDSLTPPSLRRCLLVALPALPPFFLLCRILAAYHSFETQKIKYYPKIAGNRRVNISQEPSLRQELIVTDESQLVIWIFRVNNDGRRQACISVHLNKVCRALSILFRDKKKRKGNFINCKAYPSHQRNGQWLTTSQEENRRDLTQSVTARIAFACGICWINEQIDLQSGMMCIIVPKRRPPLPLSIRQLLHLTFC